VEAAGFRLAILDGPAELSPLPDNWMLRDVRGRRLPAHLDLRRVRDYLDWWRSMHWKRHPPLPSYTYTTVRRYRDQWRAQVGEAAADEGYGQGGATPSGRR
jgi:hypothetical protein